MIINIEIAAGMSKTDLAAGRLSQEKSDHTAEIFAATPTTSEVIRKIGQAIEFMRSHLNQPLQVATLASVASISSSHFFATFKRLTGRAPIEFFINLRMRHACELLDETSLSVKEIAATLGYDDQFYFSRVFKLATQTPPTQYRMLDSTTRSAIKDSLTQETSQFRHLAISTERPVFETTSYRAQQTNFQLPQLTRHP